MYLLLLILKRMLTHHADSFSYPHIECKLTNFWAKCETFTKLFSICNAFLWCAKTFLEKNWCKNSKFQKFVVPLQPLCVKNCAEHLFLF